MKSINFVRKLQYLFLLSVVSLFSQDVDSLFTLKLWPNEVECKNWLKQNFSGQEIAFVYKDTSFGYYTFTEYESILKKTNISLAQNKKVWHRVDVIRKNDSSIQILFSKTGIQQMPDGNTPSPEIMSVEKIEKKIEKLNSKGKDSSSMQKMLAMVQEVTIYQTELLKEWLVQD